MYNKTFLWWGAIFGHVGVKMENWDWESEEQLSLKVAVLVQLSVTRGWTLAPLLQWLVLYSQGACFTLITIRGRRNVILLVVYSIYIVCEWRDIIYVFARTNYKYLKLVTLDWHISVLISIVDYVCKLLRSITHCLYSNPIQRCLWVLFLKGLVAFIKLRYLT